MEKESFLSGVYWSYIWVMGISLWAGAVSYMEKNEPFLWRKLFAHLSSASFAGFMTFLICQHTGIDGPLTGVMSGIAAHMGTPALLKLKFVRQFLDKGEDDKPAK